jgi:hypothetical protein
MITIDAAPRCVYKQVELETQSEGQKAMTIYARGVVASCLALCLGTISPAPAAVPEQPLAIAPVDFLAGTSEVLSSLTVWLGYLPANDPFEPQHHLFENFTLTPADVGRTLTATAQSDSDFPGFVGLLRNGVNDIAMFGGLNPFTGAGQYENGFWKQRPPGNNGIDLRGFSVGRITLTIDSLSINSPGENPNGDGLWTDFAFYGTVRVYTQVPEPTTLSLVVGSLLAAAIARWKSQR